MQLRVESKPSEMGKQTLLEIRSPGASPSRLQERGIAQQILQDRVGFDHRSYVNTVWDQAAMRMYIFKYFIVL